MPIPKSGEILRKLEYIITSVGSPNAQAYLEVEKIPLSVQQIGLPLGSLYTRSQGQKHLWANFEHFGLVVRPQLTNKCWNFGIKGCKLASQI
jgi:hypothetical protein